MYYQVVTTTILQSNKKILMEPKLNITTSYNQDFYDPVITAFVDSEDIKDSSRQTYRDSIKRFFEWIKDTGRVLNALTAADIISYKKHLIGTQLSELTVMSYLVAVRRFYAWAERSQLYKDIARNVKLPRRSVCIEDEDFLKMDLTEDESIRLLKYFKERSLRDYAIVNLMLRMGLRTIEVARLNVGWVKFVNGRRRLQVWRKGMDRPSSRVTLGFPDAAWQPIDEYLKTRAACSPDDPLFVTEGYGSHGSGAVFKHHSNERMSTRLIQMIVKKGLRSIGLDSHEYSAHSLRHTCAVMMLVKGATINDIQRLLGHASPKTTMIYLKSFERRQRMEAEPAQVLDSAFQF